MAINDETQRNLKQAILEAAAGYMKATCAGSCRALVSMGDFGDEHNGLCVELSEVTIYRNMTFNLQLWGKEYIVDTLVCLIEDYQLIHLGKDPRKDSMGKYLAESNR